MEKRIIIIGGGFAGINLAKQLKNKKDSTSPWWIKTTTTFFRPLLYQVATGMLDVSSISTPFRTLFKGAENIRFRMGELAGSSSHKSNRVQLSTGEVEL
jgi:NADH:ubiquinone reductase (H+-translocating)